MKEDDNPEANGTKARRAYPLRNTAEAADSFSLAEMVRKWAFFSGSWSCQRTAPTGPSFFADAGCLRPQLHRETDWIDFAGHLPRRRR